MARGYGNNDAPRRDASLDPARRIFKDDAARGTVTEALGGEEERVCARAFPRAGPGVLVGRPP